MTVGAMTVGVLTVGSMGRPHILSQCQTKKKRYGAGQKSAQTDGQADRKSDSYIPP